MLRVYAWHKLIATSSIVIVSLLGLLLFPSDQLARWNLLLLTILIFGYSHFIVGGIYQIRSFARKPEPVFWYWWFFGLTVVSTLVAIGFIAQGLVGLLAFLVIGYFMVHGFFNEITLFERQTGVVADVWLIASVALVLSAVIFNAVGHASWFFSADLTFVQPSSEMIHQYLTTDGVAVAARIAAVVLAVCAVLMQVYAAWRAGWRPAYILFLGVIVAVAVGTFVWHPLHYLFFWGALLLYHFVVWFIFFLHQFMQKNQSELPRYLILHLIILLPFVVSWMGLPGAAWIETYLLNINTFIALTLVHVTVSFLSEPWFTRWCGLTK